MGDVRQAIELGAAFDQYAQLARRVRPLTTVTGMLITSAQGQAMISRVRPGQPATGAVRGVEERLAKGSTGIATTSTASATTAGV